MSAYVTPPVPGGPPSCAARVAGPPTGRPPRPPLAAMPMMQVMQGHSSNVPVASPANSNFSGCQNEIPEDELERLKFRVSHLELGLKRRGCTSQEGHSSCSEEVAILKKELERTQEQLLEAKDEIIHAKGQIHSLAQRFNMIPLDGSGAYAVGGVADTRSNSAPMHLLTPRPVPVPVVAVSTPSCNAARDSPAPAVRVQRRPSCGSGCYPVNMPASPLPTARAPPQRRPSSPHQAPAPLSLAPSNASFAPQQRLLAAVSGGGSERASPLRTQGHI